MNESGQRVFTQSAWSSELHIMALDNRLDLDHDKMLTVSGRNNLNRFFQILFLLCSGSVYLQVCQCGSSIVYFCNYAFSLLVKAILASSPPPWSLIVMLGLNVSTTLQTLQTIPYEMYNFISVFYLAIFCKLVYHEVFMR